MKKIEFCDKIACLPKKYHICDCKFKIQAMIQQEWEKLTVLFLNTVQT